jgi:NitT/TauT family transport system permease protein
MNRLARWLRTWLVYLWSGWGAVASLLMLVAAWQLGAERLGPLLLPTPMDTFATLAQWVQEGSLWPDLAISARRALAGFALALAVGSVLGIAAGWSMSGAMLARPLVTLLLGMPPIAWLVLALLWFGSGDGTPVFTVFVASVPIVFGGALQGARTLDAPLADMARAFRLPWRQRVVDVALPHLLSYLFPAWITALGTSLKVVVMAELLSSPDGVGAALAQARSHLDTAAALAWIAAMLGLLLALEYLLLEPIKRELDRWREAAR